MRHLPDPFTRHPELRGLICDPEGSFFRGFIPAAIEADLAARGIPPGWRTPDTDRETARRAFLAGRTDGDLWIFAYGSLMWDPAFHFAEVRRTRLVGYHRKFCLVDNLGARGTPDAPGLMAALDHGGHCDGLAFRIAASDIEAETEILWRREMIAPGYIPTFAPLDIGDTAVQAVAFVADHAAALIRADIDRASQIRFLATGTGFRGSSLDYIDNLITHLDAMQIADPDLTALRDAARSHARQQT